MLKRILCPECKSSIFEHDKKHDEVICRQCGLVLESAYSSDFKPAGYLLLRLDGDYSVLCNLPAHKKCVYIWYSLK